MTRYFFTAGNQCERALDVMTSTPISSSALRNFRDQKRRTPSAKSSAMVTAAEMNSEPRHPSRFEKNRNMPPMRLGFRLSDRVGHLRAALTERLAVALGAIGGGLMLDLRIEFGTKQDDDRGHPHPHHQADRGPE